MILYPTETLYALGVHALDLEELTKLYKLKGRNASRAASWLVRDISDIRQYAQLSRQAEKVAERFLPGPLTLVVSTKEEIPRNVVAEDGTIGFRISNDPIAQRIIGDFMEERGAPLTCTSANVSGAPTYPTVGEILQQFGSRANAIDQVIDDGPRKGLASTVVRVIDNEVTVLREGDILEQYVFEVVE